MKNYTEKRLEEFDEQIEEMVKQTTYGLICEVCGGGGMFENLVCKKCEGHGLHTWRTNHLGEKIKDFLATSINQAIAEERDRLVREARQTLKKEDSDIVERVIASLYKPVTKKD